MMGTLRVGAGALLYSNSITGLTSRERLRGKPDVSRRSRETKVEVLARPVLGSDWRSAGTALPDARRTAASGGNLRHSALRPGFCSGVGLYCVQPSFVHPCRTPAQAAVSLFEVRLWTFGTLSLASPVPERLCSAACVAMA